MVKKVAITIALTAEASSGLVVLRPSLPKIGTREAKNADSRA
ncbi:hypothetical protein CHITON_0981 [Thermococcus chitonophagus]|uniref:Uncharacterized protein n=1 Tax=Thermococcus chitonophagus TaxID=54262 RepID=A0A160VSF9_9EURY|nr:hypothetical protein CHITON_0981 [Thermococcus chitonophagus]